MTDLQKGNAIKTLVWVHILFLMVLAPAGDVLAVDEINLWLVEKECEGRRDRAIYLPDPWGWEILYDGRKPFCEGCIRFKQLLVAHAHRLVMLRERPTCLTTTSETIVEVDVHQFETECRRKCEKHYDTQEEDETERQVNVLSCFDGCNAYAEIFKQKFLHPCARLTQ